MFLNFEQVFNKRQQLQCVDPNLLLQHLNSTAPDGTVYTITSDGVYVLQPISGINNFTIEGLVLENREYIAHKIGANFSPEDVVSYSYNAQKTIIFKPNKTDKIVINGTRLDLDKAIIDPTGNEKFVKNSAHFFLMPAPFPPPHKITLGDGSVEKDILISRVPNDSLNVITFESCQCDSLVFRSNYDKQINKMDFNIKIDLSNSTSVSDYIEALSIFVAFYNGTIRINGVRMGEMTCASPEVSQYQSVLSFWRKVNEVEKALSLNFNPHNNRISDEEYRAIEELYQTLVNKNPIKTDRTIDAMWFTDDFDSEQFDAHSNIPLAIQYVNEAEYSFLGTQFKVFRLYAIFFCKLTHYEKTLTGYRVDVEKSSDDKPMIVSIMNFAQESDLEAFRAQMTDSFEALRCAKTLNEYLIQVQS